MHNLHNGTEGYKFITPSIKCFLAKITCKLLDKFFVMSFGSCKKLHHIKYAFCFILLQQTIKLVISKLIGGHHFRNMFLFLPSYPFLFNRRIYLYGYIINDHVLNTFCFVIIWFSYLTSVSMPISPVMILPG